MSILRSRPVRGPLQIYMGRAPTQLALFQDIPFMMQGPPCLATPVPHINPQIKGVL
jgi:hypothetical protein